MSDFLKPQSPLQHKDGAYIYPLTTADQVILEDNSRLNTAFENLVYVSEENQETAIVPLNADTLNGQLPNYYAPATKLTPRNLLDNSDFTNPVNQRGQTSYTGLGYSIDRWLSPLANTVTINADSINVSGNFFVQKVESKKLTSGKYTIGFMLKTGLCMGSVDVTGFSVSKEVNVYVQNGIRVTLYRESESVYQVYICPDTAIDLLYAFMYKGEYTIDTLPEYQPKGYGVELAECQRYFYVIPSWSVFAFGTIDFNGSVGIIVPVGVMMRVNPDVIMNGSTINYFTVVPNCWYNTSEIVVAQVRGNTVMLTPANTLDATTLGNTPITTLNASNYPIYLDADL